MSLSDSLAQIVTHLTSYVPTRAPGIKFTHNTSGKTNIDKVVERSFSFAGPFITTDLNYMGDIKTETQFNIIIHYPRMEEEFNLVSNIATDQNELFNLLPLTHVDPWETGDLCNVEILESEISEDKDQWTLNLTVRTKQHGA